MKGEIDLVKFLENLKNKKEEDKKIYIFGEVLEKVEDLTDQEEKREWNKKYANYIFKEKDTEIYLDILNDIDEEIINNNEEIIELKEKKIEIDKEILEKNKRIGKLIKEYNRLVNISTELDNINNIENYYSEGEFKLKEKRKEKIEEGEDKKERREL